MPLEVPRAEMFSLQVLVDRHKKYWHPKIATQTGSSTKKKTTGKKVSKNSVNLGIWGGVDLAWVLWDSEERAQEIDTKSTQVPATNSASFSVEIRAQKSTASSPFPLCLLVPVF